MIDLAQIERINVSDEQSLGQLEDILSEVAGFAETRSAAEIASLLEKKQPSNPTIAEWLHTFINKFKSLALPLLSDAEIIVLFDHLRPIIADERIGLYERLRARLLVMPVGRRKQLAEKILEKLRQSKEPLGRKTISYDRRDFPPTLSSWIIIFEHARGDKRPEAFFSQPATKELDEGDELALRHLVHIVTLLTSVESIELSVAQRSMASPEQPPTPPVNLPVGPPARPIPVVPTPPKQPSPVPRPVITGDRGPTLAAVLKRLQQAGGEPGSSPAVTHLSPDDEEEIQSHSQKLAEYQLQPNVHNTIADKIDELIAKHTLSFPDDNIRRRFVTIVTSRLKDIRTTPETTELLSRSTKIGGVGLDPTVAEAIAEEAEAGAEKFYDHREVRQIEEREKLRTASPVPKPPRVPVTPPSPPPAPAAPLPSPPVFTPTVRAMPMADVRPVSRMAPATSAAAMRATVSTRPSMSDIRGTSRLVGPVEELRNMTVDDFRRLGADPVACVRRVYEKIQRLGMESFTKKAEGIRAWRESGAYRLYVAMGHESLVTQKTITDVIGQRQAAGQPALTTPEFALIADLNRKLRF